MSHGLVYYESIQSYIAITLTDDFYHMLPFFCIFLLEKDLTMQCFRIMGVNNPLGNIIYENLGLPAIG